MGFRSANDLQGPNDAKHRLFAILTQSTVAPEWHWTIDFDVLFIIRWCWTLCIDRMEIKWPIEWCCVVQFVEWVPLLPFESMVLIWYRLLVPSSTSCAKRCRNRRSSSAVFTQQSTNYWYLQCNYRPPASGLLSSAYTRLAYRFSVFNFKSSVRRWWATL